eukprot:1156916-Pelagomonas_calceolata.AAC.5
MDAANDQRNNKDYVLRGKHFCPKHLMHEILRTDLNCMLDVRQSWSAGPHTNEKILIHERKGDSLAVTSWPECLTHVLAWWLWGEPDPANHTLLIMDCEAMFRHTNPCALARLYKPLIPPMLRGAHQ